MAIDKKNYHSFLMKSFLDSEAPDHFLKKAYQFQKDNSRYFSYESCAKKGNFQSRTHVYQLINGKRKLNLLTIKKLSKALNFNADIEKALAALTFAKEIGSTEDKKNVDKFRQKFKSKLTTKNINRLRHHCWPLLFSSIGSGRTINEIFEITGLTQKVIKEELQAMIEQKIVTYDKASSNYYTTSEHVDLRKISHDDIFQELFIRNLKECSKRAQKKFSSENHSFFNSYFSINKQKLPELTKRFNDLLSEFTEGNIVEDQKSIVTVIGALYPQN